MSAAPLETSVSRHTLRFTGPRRPDLLPPAGLDPRLWLHRNARPEEHEAGTHFATATALVADDVPLSDQ